MAEFVQLRMEEWVDILTELARMEIFSRKEMNQIKRELKSREYAIQNQNRCLQVILDYANYQLEVLQKIKKRREKLQLFEKQQEIDEKIKYRINSLYGVYARTFANDEQYWMARLMFVQGLNWTEQVSKVYQEIIKHLGPKDPAVYLDASNYEWTRDPLKFMESARTILQKGIRSFNSNVDLYAWLYELELKHADHLMMLHETIQKKAPGKLGDKYKEDAEKSLQAAEIAYRQALCNCTGDSYKGSFYLRFIRILFQYSRFHDRVQLILGDVKKHCLSKVEARDVSARTLFEIGEIGEGIRELEEGLKESPDRGLFDCSINVLHDLVKGKPSSMIYKKLHEILVWGLKEQQLSEKAFSTWLHLCSYYNKFKTEQLHGMTNGTHPNTEDEKIFSRSERLKVLEAASTKYQTNVSFKVELISAKFLDGCLTPEDLISSLNSLAANDPKAAKIADQGIMGSILVSYPDVKIREMVRTNYFKNSPERAARGLTYLFLADGILSARKFYEELQGHVKNSYLVMKTIAEMEYRNMDHKMDREDKLIRFRKIMEEASIYHGTTSVAVWIDYLNFERGLRNDDKVAQIYRRGLHTLADDSLKEELILKYNEMNRDMNDY